MANSPYRIAASMPDARPSFPPFTAKATCPKCGREHIRDKYTAATSSTPEHMQRECFVCAYQWQEAPLDASATNP